MTTNLILIAEVSAAINRIYDIKSTVEYPGYVNIPERFINDDVDGSDDAWAIGPDVDGSWTGQLMTPDGSEVRSGMTFTVYPQSNDPDVIANAVYCHGIGDWYVGGGCSDTDCPRKQPR